MIEKCYSYYVINRKWKVFSLFITENSTPKAQMLMCLSILSMAAVAVKWRYIMPKMLKMRNLVMETKINSYTYLVCSHKILYT